MTLASLWGMIVLLVVMTAAAWIAAGRGRP